MQDKVDLIVAYEFTPASWCWNIWIKSSSSDLPNKETCSPVVDVFLPFHCQSFFFTQLRTIFGSFAYQRASTEGESVGRKWRQRPLKFKFRQWRFRRLGPLNGISKWLFSVHNAVKNGVIFKYHRNFFKKFHPLDGCILCHQWDARFLKNKKYSVNTS